MDILEFLKSPLGVMLISVVIAGFGVYLKNKTELRNQLIPVFLFIGSLVEQIIVELGTATPASASFGGMPVAISFGFFSSFGQLLLNSLIQTGNAMVLHGLGKITKQKFFDPHTS